MTGRCLPGAARVAQTRTQIQTEIAIARDQYLAANSLADRYQSGLLDKARKALDLARYADQSSGRSQLELLDAVKTYGDTRGGLPPGGSRSLGQRLGP